MTPVVGALRPHQWIKNLLVFAAPAGAGVIDEGEALVAASGAFVSFCAASSAGYLLNDVVDRHHDRRHPTKARRPVAAGTLTVAAASVAGAVLTTVAVALAALVRVELAATVAVYLAVVGCYSLGLKRVPWLEVAALASAFVLRAHGGAVATDVTSSGWFLIVVSAVGAFVVLRKRWCERRRSGETTRPVLAHYRAGALRVASDVAASAAIAGHLSWALTEGSSTPRLVATIAFGAAVVRYGVLTTDDDRGDPVLVLARDPALAALAAVWALGFVVAAA